MRPTVTGKALSVLLVLAIAAAVAVSQFNRVIIFYISRSCDLDISYADMKGSVFRKAHFRDLKALSRASGNGIFSNNGSVSLKLKRLYPADLAIDIEFLGVNFVKRAPDTATTYTDLPELVSSPFSSKWRYEKISAVIEIVKGMVRIEDLRAIGDEIRLFLSGNLYADNAIESDVRILFSSRLTSKIPQELSGAVLQDEADGWKSLSVKLSGNYRDPSIQVSGKSFRLNIRSVSAPGKY